MRDPLLDPEPGDVVRAKDAASGAPAVFVVLDVGPLGIRYSVCWLALQRVDVSDAALREWRDWSAWTDVAVLS